MEISNEMVKAAHAAHTQAMWEGGTEDDRMRAALEAVAPAIRAAAMEEAAMAQASTALNDWLSVYATEYMNAGRVREAKTRIRENGGTLAYIAIVQEAIRAALPTPEATE